MSITTLRPTEPFPVLQLVGGAGLLLSVAVLAATLSTSIASAQPGPAPIAASGFVYTANELGNSLSRIDLSTGEVLTVPVPITPHNVQVTADGKILLAVGTAVSEMGGDHEHEANGILLVFSAADLAAGPVAEIEVGDHPAHVITNAGGTRAFVSLPTRRTAAYSLSIYRRAPSWAPSRPVVFRMACV